MLEEPTYLRVYHVNFAVLILTRPCHLSAPLRS